MGCLLAYPVSASLGAGCCVRQTRHPAPRPLAHANHVTQFIARLDASNANIEVRRLRGNVSVLMGSGGNITVLVEPEGKLMVDAGIAVSEPKIVQPSRILGVHRTVSTTS
jgi:hypothetical protein